MKPTATLHNARIIYDNRLTGTVEGHHSLPNGTVYTSRCKRIIQRGQSVVTTRNTRYVIKSWNIAKLIDSHL